MSETRLSSERIYDGKVLNLRIDQVQFENGDLGRREVIEHHGAVAIVPITAAGEIVMVRQFRTPTAKTLLEIPAGTINSGESPDECASREIVEEINFSAGKLERLFGMYVAPGYSDEYITVYLATELTSQEGVGDEDEFIEITTLSLSAALDKIQSGEIEDAKSIVGLLALARRRDGK